MELQQYADQLVAVADEHGFPLWLGFGTCYRGWCLTLLDEPREGLALATDAPTIIRATGAAKSTSFALMVLAEAYARLNRPSEGLDCVSEASAIMAATDERYWESELYRVRGDLLTETGDQCAAEQSYLQAITVAKRQSAKLFELRAATSLARFWRDQGRVAEARDVLAPVYNWFTEGFDTPVLKDAKALLDELAG